ncbi:Aste57867_7539 [Aphanomyces stellatus]|uniref:Aste57867_7539 protein n=1 Tax=Aphanomyces stellatus TaxID=120398 RepID=A0A485KIH3_9STRA|nr:hypothetical protein As57867_007513 [Aphanomyces stellatus]VFT84448.1 Aste57867_7539 [Aphanomyces stellatus]
MTGSPSSAKKTKLGGYYADPRSPIASTPLKRQRTTPHPTSEAKKDVQVAPIALDDDEAPATTRRLNMNVDDDEDETSTTDAKVDDAATEEKHKESNVDLFSPALKVEKTGRTSLQPSPPDSPGSPGEPDAEEPEDTSSVHKDEEAVELDFNPSDQPLQFCAHEIIGRFYFMKTLPHYDEVKELARPVALPAKHREAPKICLVLDLDETLVHCTIDDLPQADMKFPIEYDNTEYMVSVKRRPFMMEFLSQVSEWFEVVVFTASQRVYAEKLLNLLDPYNQFIQHRLYRESCLPVDGNYLKDLNVLGRDLAHVLLIDNSPHAFGYQVSNGIPIESWFSDENDTELLKLLPFLESLMHAEDVRPVVSKQFQIQRLIDTSMLE